VVTVDYIFHIRPCPFILPTPCMILGVNPR